MILAPLAFKAFDAMLKLYDRKYGKSGERVVKKLKRRLVEAHIIVARLDEENADLRIEIEDLKKLIDKAHAAANHYRIRYNEQLAIVAARDGGVRELDPDPYADGGGDDGV